MSEKKVKKYILGSKETTQKIEPPIFKVEGKTLDLGCGNKKIPGALGVNYSKTTSTDLVWNLKNTLPKEYWNSFDLVYNANVMDCLGNPQKFLEDCVLYAKPNGFVQIIVDNGDYWRFHKLGRPFGNYHATLWLKHSPVLEIQHKMMFQPGHLKTLFGLVGLEVVEEKLFWRQHIDYFFPKHLGTAYYSIVGKKEELT